MRPKNRPKKVNAIESQPRVIAKMRTENEELRAALEAARAAAAADVLRADQAEERAALLAEREAAVEKNRQVNSRVSNVSIETLLKRLIH